MEGKPRDAAARITVDEFAEVATKAFLRALDARKEPKRPFGPIIFGYIFWPEGGFPGGFESFGAFEGEGRRGQQG
jgi:hypothetical protein